MTAPLDTVLTYHERTKHHFHRYAAGPGGLDWATQPDPFRTFADSPQTALPLLADGMPPSRFADLHRPGRIAPQPLTLATVAALLELSLGLAAWKAYGDTRWALRCNPSSGNLHPTEAYLVAQGCGGIADGIHHYLSRDHLLERRRAFDTSADLLPGGCLLLGLSSIHWREAWKYGERAYRYCQHDIGHAIAAIRYAAAALGWRAALLDDWGDGDIAALLGLDRASDFADAEREHPDALLLISTRSAHPDACPIAAEPLLRAAGEWTGRANRLSPRHAHDWPVIEEAARACAKPALRQPALQRSTPPAPALPAPEDTPCTASAAALIRQRRSAQAFDGVTAIAAPAFYRMLDMTLPRADLPPWDAIPWTPRIHLALFVHRVDDLMPGLYLLPRTDRAEARLRAELSPAFQWTRVEDCPPYLPLYRLLVGDTREVAKALSCHQDIAADGAFSLGMLAEYEDGLAAGPWVYRRMFWEAGMLGQVLYLEAEAAGLRGTGIGCFFDDDVHALLGIRGRGLQSLYHFTVGGALADTRLQSLPPYAHLNRRPSA